MVEIGGRPILWHIMKHYAHHGFTEFVVALGYKGEVIKRYFSEYHALSGSMTPSRSMVAGVAYTGPVKPRAASRGSKPE